VRGLLREGARRVLVIDDLMTGHEDARNGLRRGKSAFCG